MKKPSRRKFMAEFEALDKLQNIDLHDQRRDCSLFSHPNGLSAGTAVFWPVELIQMITHL